MNHTKKGRLRKTVLLVTMLCILLLSAFVYLKSTVYYLTSQESDSFGLISYLVGYIMTEICLGAAIYEIASKRNHIISLLAAFACMALRLVFDIFTVLSDGLALSGLFQMDVFIVLDLLILGCTIVVICKGSKIANALLVVLTIIYLFGEVAGYSIHTFDDIDEFVLMFSIFAVAMIPLISSQKHNSDF